MINKFHCITLYSKDIEKSKEFYQSIGFKLSWTISDISDDGNVYTRLGFKARDDKSTQFVIQDNPNSKKIDIELSTDDVLETYNELKNNPDIKWLSLPEKNEFGHIAIFEAPDKNIFLLTGK